MHATLIAEVSSVEAFAVAARGWLSGTLAGAVRASGAFYEVSQLPHGALWLRATPTINQFTGERVRQVFEALSAELSG
jgi:hypothetical protein